MPPVPPVQSPLGAPAAIQAWNVEISAAASGAAGGGGICAIVLLIRSRQRWPTVRPPRVAVRSAWVLRWIGAPSARVAP